MKTIKHCSETKVAKKFEEFVDNCLSACKETHDVVIDRYENYKGEVIFRATFGLFINSNVMAPENLIACDVTYNIEDGKYSVVGKRVICNHYAEDAAIKEVAGCLHLFED